MGHATITVQARDASGHNLTMGGDAVMLSTNHGALSAVTDNNNGTYTATLSDDTVGFDVIAGTINGQELRQGGVRFVPAPSCTVRGGFETCVYTAVGFAGWLVPDGLTSPTVSVEARGASGGDGAGSIYQVIWDLTEARGGLGVDALGDVTVSPGDQLLLEIGGHGANGDMSSQFHVDGGFPDGGGAFPSGGTGGGSSHAEVVRSGESQLHDLMFAAGGGGGGSVGGRSYEAYYIGLGGQPSPRGGEGGDADSAGQPGADGNGDPYGGCPLVSGGNRGETGFAVWGGSGAGGAGGARGATTCTTGDSPDFNGENGGPWNGGTDGGSGGWGASLFGTSGDGGGGGGGFFGGGGGGTGGNDEFLFPEDPAHLYDFAAGAGGGGGGVPWSTSLVTNGLQARRRPRRRLDQPDVRSRRHHSAGHDDRFPPDDPRARPTRRSRQRHGRRGERLDH